MKLKALVEVRPTLSSLAAGKGMKVKQPDPLEFHEKEEARLLSQGLAWDDLTNMQLDAGKVTEARKKEMDKDNIILVNLSGRGDKDILTVAKIDGIEGSIHQDLRR